MEGGNQKASKSADRGFTWELVAADRGFTWELVAADRGDADGSRLTAGCDFTWQQQIVISSAVGSNRSILWWLQRMCVWAVWLCAVQLVTSCVCVTVCVVQQPSSVGFDLNRSQPDWICKFQIDRVSIPTRSDPNSKFIGSGRIRSEDKEVFPADNKQLKDDKNGLLVNGSEDFEAVSSDDKEVVGDNDKLISRAINATIVLGAGTFAVTRLLTIDHDYWHGWTLYEILRYVPEHNWIAYEQALKANPVLAKMAISGIVYFIGDWIAQCYEGKPLFDFDLQRMFRSGLVGFTLHGSLSHYYYKFCEALFPFQDWWVVPAKVAFDQTVWAAVWNSIYFVVLGFLRFESAANIFSELKSTFWPMLTAGWKLWPFAHLVTYSVIPVEQRLLWVDCVELIWVTILSTYSNEKSEARILEATTEANSDSSSISHELYVAFLVPAIHIESSKLTDFTQFMFLTSLGLLS
ncbi:peroxisomal membrane 22 kDa (Mpv17/PMP22) family protein [Citrus sinensis]|nr:peroxisomal membrane 22 kDa (Mpv17/PMP22) family protein [Citrus sinensis]